MVKRNTDPEAVAATAAEENANAVANFSWAVNAVKLNRAKAWVNTQPDLKDLKGAALEAAVKARYTEMAGLLSDEKPTRASKTGGKVQNVAEDDGSKD